MRKACVFNFGNYAGDLIERDDGSYSFEYNESYMGAPISLTMPVNKKVFHFKQFPPFFDGLLPEGILLEALLKNAKIDRKDYFTQIVTVGKDLVGSVTVEGDA